MRLRGAAFLLTLTATLGWAALPGATLAQTAPTPPAGGKTEVGDPDVAARGQAQQDFTIVNSTGHNVVALNVSPSNEDSWGPDILGGEKLGNGESAQITFDRGETECKWDIRATYDDGDATDVRDVNLCEVVTVTLTAN